ncbi:MAG: hypothetical protein B6244_11245 [Candidatus Cloacimonetes bacterium 4572_55]|nr:MAG: hypothetical protein B6244_11245 [Candidatus Cloacimonetes bacterium 4572_55]
MSIFQWYTYRVVLSKKNNEVIIKTRLFNEYENDKELIKWDPEESIKWGPIDSNGKDIVEEVYDKLNKSLSSSLKKLPKTKSEYETVKVELVIKSDDLISKPWEELPSKPWDELPSKKNLIIYRPSEKADTEPVYLHPGTQLKTLYLSLNDDTPVDDTPVHIIVVNGESGGEENLKQEYPSLGVVIIKSDEREKSLKSAQKLIDKGVPAVFVIPESKDEPKNKDENDIVEQLEKKYPVEYIIHEIHSEKNRANYVLFKGAKESHIFRRIDPRFRKAFFDRKAEIKQFKKSIAIPFPNGSLYRKHTVTFITGHPGFGKTWLLRWCYNIVENSTFQCAIYDREIGEAQIVEEFVGALETYIPNLGSPKSWEDLCKAIKKPEKSEKNSLPWKILFFDADVVDHDNKWLYDLSKKLNEFLIMIVIASQRKRGRWIGEQILTEKEISLKGFSKNDTHNFLRKREITDNSILEAVTNEIPEAERSPFKLDLLAESKPRGPEDVFNPTRMYVKKILRGTTDPLKKQLLLFTAVFPTLDDNSFRIVADAIPGFPEREEKKKRDELFNWLRDHEFHKNESESFKTDKISYHSLIRDPMLKIIRADYPLRWDTLHSARGKSMMNKESKDTVYNIFSEKGKIDDDKDIPKIIHVEICRKPRKNLQETFDLLYRCLIIKKYKIEDILEGICEAGKTLERKNYIKLGRDLEDAYGELAQGKKGKLDFIYYLIEKGTFTREKRFFLKLMLLISDSHDRLCDLSSCSVASKKEGWDFLPFSLSKFFKPKTNENAWYHNLEKKYSDIQSGIGKLSSEEERIKFLNLICQNRLSNIYFFRYCTENNNEFRKKAINLSEEVSKFGLDLVQFSKILVKREIEIVISRMEFVYYNDTSDLDSSLDSLVDIGKEFINVYIEDLNFAISYQLRYYIYFIGLSMRKNNKENNQKNSLMELTGLIDTYSEKVEPLVKKPTETEILGEANKLKKTYSEKVEP